MLLEQYKDNLTEAVKTLSYPELDELSSEIRTFLIDSVSKTGGHLASNLGAVELTIAIHRVFDTSKDKLIWDVGHQSYVHKILTGRIDGFKNLRNIDGLSGFPKRSESIHDYYDSGHSSTSVSAAFGYAKARDLRGEDYSCVAVIGDGALTGGVSFEGLNAAGSDRTPLIVILNDNEMSIDSPTGGMARHLHRLRTSKSYQNFKNSIKTSTKNKPRVYRRLEKIRDSVKYLFLPAKIFEELGFKYFGPIDGHNIKAITECLEFAQSLQRPVLIHVMTKKGKGYAPAEENPSKFHGVGTFNPETETAEAKANKNSYSDIFGEKLNELAQNNDKIVAVSAAMINATGLNYMKNSFPDRVFDAGIAEQHAVSFAAGLALNGLRPVVAIYSTFLQRAYDQIVTEVALQNLPVIFAVDRAGITGKDGETHQGMFDISYLNSIPNMTVLSPRNGAELCNMLEFAFTLTGPVAIRYPRENTDLVWENRPFSIAPELMTEEREFAILALGSMVKEAVAASDILLKKGYRTCVYDMKCAKPISNDFLKRVSSRYKGVITVEDGCLNGGFGQKVACYFAEHGIMYNLKCIAWPDKFIEHGSIADLRKRYCMDAAGIAETAGEFFEKQIRY